MENKEKTGYNTIDLFYIAKSLFKRIWLIVLCGLLFAGIGFSISKFAIAPTYASEVKLYVNNKSASASNPNYSISSADIYASQSLVRTYGEILNSRSTLELVIEKADLDYTWMELSKMIEYASANDTEIMRITVACNDPYEACEIANTIAEVLPIRISEIIDGSTMKVADPAVPNTQKVAPSVTTYTAIGLLIGVIISAGILVVLAVLDNTIHDEDYVISTFEYPILGRVSNLMHDGKKTYGYGYYTQKPQKDGK